MINTRRLPVWVSGLKTWKDDVVVVATGCGLCGKPRRGFPSSARAERHVHADSRDAVDSRGGNHLLSDQVLKEHWGVALWARSSHAYRTSEQIAVAASTLAEETLTAPAALVDRVRHQRFAALENLAHIGQIGRGSLMTKSITALLASARAVPRACRGPWSAAHQAATRTLTPTLTHGHIAGRRHGQVFVGQQLGPVDDELRIALDRPRRSSAGRGAQRTASSGPPARCSASSPPSVPLVNAGAAATNSLSSARPLSRNEGPLR
jgi:hypothetical protein